MGTDRQLYKMKMPVPVLVVACLLSLAASDPLSMGQNCQHAACNQNNVVGNHAGQHQPQHGGQQHQPEHGGGQHHQGGGVNVPGGARIPGVHIPGVHIPGVHIPGTHVPGVHVKVPSPHHESTPQHRQPVPQHHQPSHPQASISQNCEGSHCNQNNFLRRK